MKNLFRVSLWASLRTWYQASFARSRASCADCFAGVTVPEIGGVTFLEKPNTGATPGVGA